MRGNNILQLCNSDYNNISNKHNVIDVLNVGQRKFLMNSFKPNGMKEVSCGKSYLKMRPICNDALSIKDERSFYPWTHFNNIMSFSTFMSTLHHGHPRQVK